MLSRSAPTLWCSHGPAPPPVWVTTRYISDGVELVSVNQPFLQAPRVNKIITISKENFVGPLKKGK